MNYIVRLIFIGFIVTSCSNAPSISFSTEIFDEESLSICKQDPCSNVSLSYPVAAGDTAISEKINTLIERHIIEALFMGDEESSSSKSIEDAATNFILSYRDHQADIPSEIDTGTYVAEISMEVMSRKEQLISFKSEHYQFTGGAHGNNDVVFVNIDPASGTMVDVSEITRDFEGLQKLVEEKFRLKFKIPENESVNYPGFWFEDDQFYLSNNIGFTENDMIILYNPYEIAPYAEGPIQLSIPLKEVTSYLEIIDL